MFMKLSDLPKERLVALVEHFATLALTLDGLWFTSVEDELGLNTALRLDEEVWAKFGEIEGRRIMRLLGSQERGLKALADALEHMQLAHVKGMSYEVEKKGDCVVFTITDCRPQKARIRNGRGEFPCKFVGVTWLSSFAKAINPEIRVECVLCPPDPHPDDLWCKWVFKLRE